MSGHGDGADFDSRDAAEGECQVAHKWWLGDELHAETDDTKDLLDLNPDGDGDMEPIVQSEEEFD